MSGESTKKNGSHRSFSFALFVVIIILIGLISISIIKNSPEDKELSDSKTDEEQKDSEGSDKSILGKIITDAAEGIKSAESIDEKTQDDENDLKQNDPSKNPIFEKQKVLDRNIAIKTDLTTDQYLIKLDNTNVEIEAQKMKIISSEMISEMSPNEKIIITNIDGLLAFDGKKVEFTGMPESYTSNYQNINFNTERPVSFVIEEGKITVDLISFDSLDSFATGTLNINEKVSITLKDNTVIIKDYKGSYTAEIYNENHENEKTILTLDGNAAQVITDISGTQVLIE